MSDVRGAVRSRLGGPGVWTQAVLVALVVFLLPRAGTAQVALEQYQPAPLVSDGFVLGRPALLAERAYALLAGIDYANDPLVYRLDRGPGVRQAVVTSHLVVQLAAALAVHRRITAFANLPVHALMRGDEQLIVPNTAPDGAALGDLSLGARAALVGVDSDGFALAGELIARLPTAELVQRDQRYAGAQIGSYEGALVGELRQGRFAERVRLGVRLQRTSELQNLELGPALTFGLGLRAQLLRGLALHAELFGATYLSNAFRAQHTPLELLVGPKYQRDAWWAGVAAGLGLVDGYGSPDFRLLASFGFAPPPRRSRAVAETHSRRTIDTDGDGVLDDTDRCAAEPEDRDGVDDGDGCREPLPQVAPAPVVAQPADPCRAEPSGELPAGSKGCPDRDGDRIGDATDRCPSDPGPVSEQGCPHIELPAQPEVDVEFGHVEFGAARDVHASSSLPTLRAVQSILSVNTHLLRTRVEGHADDTKDTSKNLELSRRRARSIARWLVAHGVAATRLELVACGERYPTAAEPTASARQKNRRVEFYVVDPTPREALAHPDCEPVELR